MFPPDVDLVPIEVNVFLAQNMTAVKKMPAKILITDYNLIG